MGTEGRGCVLRQRGLVLAGENSSNTQAGRRGAACELKQSAIHVQSFERIVIDEQVGIEVEMIRE